LLVPEIAGLASQQNCLAAVIRDILYQKSIGKSDGISIAGLRRKRNVREVLRKSGQNRRQVHGEPKETEAFFRIQETVFPGECRGTCSITKPFPFVIERGEGSKVFDLDGNAYVDFW